jgi:EAL domain-containing protein (putative c-di-GMP-specific phosphodiesterase class I)
MPGLDGLSLLKRIRARDLDVPVVLVTAAPSVESAMRAVELGALRYLVKPVGVPELRETVAQAIRMYRLARLKRDALAYLGDAGGWMGDRAGLDVRFTSALETLWMAYQPIVRWSDRRTFAHEALVRIREPSLPNPGALLAAAERLGRLDELGRLIRSQVAGTLAAAPEVPLVFVNVHSRDLLDDALYDAAAPLSKLAPRVVLEITERASLEAIQNLRQRIAALRALGYRVALDDLGAGYAALTSMTELEPEIVKLDMALVRNLHLEETKRQLVRSMVSLCRDMGLLVVAEGVETTEERDALVDLGCDLMQGYLFARPGPPFPAAVL